MDLTKLSHVFSAKPELIHLSEGIARRNRWRANPLEYFQERLGIKPETLNWSLLPAYIGHEWDGTPNPMMEIVNGLKNNQWVGVESATGVGKTFLGACIVFWFLECWPQSVVVTTAPKEDQLSLHIWKEVGKLYEQFARGELLTLELRMIPGREDWIAIGFVAGVAADENETSANKARGFHAKDMLIILEETPGLPQPIITAFQDTCTAHHNLILAFGNPDNQLDSLHRFCGLPNVKRVRISAYDHPNVVLKNPNFIPGAATEKSIQEKIDRYGPGNALEQSRNRGISPSQAADSLIQLEWCLQAKNRKIENDPVTANAMGVDVANSLAGDKAAKAFGKGHTCLWLKSFPCPNANQLGHQVAKDVKDYDIRELAVDGIGVGAGTVNTLIDDHHLSVDPLTGDPFDGYPEEFNSLRSQMWWFAREDLRMGVVAIAFDDPELFSDLTTPKWEIRSGKICVEDKRNLKKRIGRSPDKGDAFVYWNWARRKLSPPAPASSEPEWWLKELEAQANQGNGGAWRPGMG